MQAEIIVFIIFMEIHPIVSNLSYLLVEHLFMQFHMGSHYFTFYTFGITCLLRVCLCNFTWGLIILYFVHLELLTS